MALGDFGALTTPTEKTNKIETMLIIAVFFFATFFTHVTMINMLIAIMGDSFARAMENKETFRIQTKLTILN